MLMLEPLVDGRFLFKEAHRNRPFDELRVSGNKPKIEVNLESKS
jgi:hypothetical protein